MKKICRTLMCLFLSFCFYSCVDEYDDSMLREEIRDLTNRVLALEKWCDSTNEQILSLKSLIDALEERDYVTNIEALSDKSGYILYFYNSDPITVLHGKDGIDGNNGQDGKDGLDGEDGKNGNDGISPIISIKKDTDGIYYWVLDGIWLLDEEGNKLNVSGHNGQNGENGKDGHSPQISIDVDTDGVLYWKIDGEWLLFEDSKVPASSQKNTTLIKDITIDEQNGCVYITLNENDEMFSIPILNNSVMHFDLSESGDIYQDKSTTFTIKLPSNLKNDEYEGILIEVYSGGAENSKIVTIPNYNDIGNMYEMFQVAVEHPNFIEQTGLISSDLKITLTDSHRAVYNAIGLIKVSILSSTRENLSASRTFTYKFGDFDINYMPDDRVVCRVNGIYYECESGKLSETLENVSDASYVYLGGKINSEDFLILQKYKSSLKDLHIYPRYEYMIPENNFKDFALLEYVWFSESNSNLVGTIESNAFENCTQLLSIYMGHGMIIGNEAFKGCNSLVDLNVRKSQIKSNAFEDCVALNGFTLVDSEVADYIFKGCTNLHTLSISGKCTFSVDSFTDFNTSNCSLWLSSEYTSEFEGNNWKGYVWNSIN